MKRKLGLAAIALAWLALPAVGAHFLFAPHTSADRTMGSGRVEHKIAVRTNGSLGHDRDALLLQVTSAYLKDHPQAPAAVAAGKALAPVDFLNDQLAARHAKWRVRAVHGLDAEIYEVS